eukprot:scaffold1335_cov102-Isochrysis_galbana.AAC.13
MEQYYLPQSTLLGACDLCYICTHIAPLPASALDPRPIPAPAPHPRSIPFGEFCFRATCFTWPTTP